MNKKKSVKKIESFAPTNIKREKLGLWMLTSLVIGNMVGSGILLVPSSMAAIGTISLFAYMFTAIGSFLLALVFAKMSILVPKTGGPYAYAKFCFGNYMGFQTAYIYWIMVLLGNAAVVVTLVGYLTVFFPVLNNPYLAVLLEITMIWIFTAVNLIGIRTAGIIQIITTLLKFIPLLIIAIFGWFYFHPEYVSHCFNVSNKSNFSAFSYAATMFMWLFIGLESATIPAGCVKNPKRNIPLATILGIAISVLIYLACIIALMGMFPNSLLAKSNSPFAAGAGIIFGKWGEFIAATGAIISCLGVLNGWTLVQGQIPMAAAKDKLFPGFFAKCNHKGIPVRALIISSIIVSVSLFFTISKNLTDQFQLLIMNASITALLTYFYSAIAEMSLLSKIPQKPYKKFINMLVGLGAAAYSFWALFGSGEAIVFYVTMLLLSSVPLYAWLKSASKKMSFISPITESTVRN